MQALPPFPCNFQAIKKRSAAMTSLDNVNGNSASLKGRVALVTGASRGIGRAVAVELATRGADVALNYNSSKEKAEQLAEELRAIGANCMLVQGDVSCKEDAQRVIQEILDNWKRLDIIVNNAGISRDKSLRKMTEEEWDKVISVNLNGTFYCTKAALPAMIDQKFGRIINISSMVGQIGAFGQANYSASKGAVIAFTKTVALEMARYNITANVIAPGYTSTEMISAMPQEVLDQIKEKIPLHRLCQPEEIGKAAAFLAAEGDYITGQQLNVNGGMYM
jgi:acetoacetyl-CoA reductase/3-oxoacyl-[acyl-carrier protein] reductase